MQVFNHELLLKTRLELGLTQEETAESVGVDVRTYRRYESGSVNDPRAGFPVRQPSRRQMLARLSAELGLALEDLTMEVTAVEEAVLSRAIEGDGAGHEPRTYAPFHAQVLQRALHFVGRENMLDRLRAWAEAERPHARVVALVAIGGAGKTALAERFLADRGDAPRCGGTFVWSFYEDDRVESFLSHAFTYLAGGLVRHESAAVLTELLPALGSGPPHLLVLDGLERVQTRGGRSPRNQRVWRSHGELRDPQLRRLLAALVRGLGGARVLVTSRLVLSDLVAWEGSGLETIHIEDLTETEGVDLLRRFGVHAGVMDRPRALERNEDLRALFGRTGGHALSLAMTGSYVGAFLGGDARRLETRLLTDLAGDDSLARRLLSVLSTYSNSLSLQERDLLARISIFPSGAGERTLEAIVAAGGDVAGSLVGLDRRGLWTVQARLARLGLLFSTGDGYAAHAFLRDYFRKLLHGPEDSQECEDRVYEVERARIQAHIMALEFPMETDAGGAGNDIVSSSPLPQASDFALPDIWSPPLPRVSDYTLLEGEELHALLELGQYEFKSRFTLLDVSESLDAYEALLRNALASERPSYAFAVYSSVFAFERLGILRGDLTRGARIAAAFVEDGDFRRGDKSLPPESCRVLYYDAGSYAGALGDLAAAEGFYVACLELKEKVRGPRTRPTVRRALAYTVRLAGDLESARKIIGRSLAEAAESGQHFDVARGAALLGILHHDMGECDAAASAFARAREVEFVKSREPGHPVVVGRGVLWEAEHKLAVGYPKEARSIAEEYLTWCRNLQWLGQVAHCHIVLGLTAVSTDPVAARRDLNDARRSARASGNIEMILRCHDLAARVALADARTDEALREAAEGRELATSLRFGLFRGRLAALWLRCLVEQDPASAAEQATAMIGEVAVGDAWGMAEAQHYAGVALAKAGDRKRAHELLQAAIALRTRIRHPEVEASRRAARDLEAMPVS